MPVHLAQDHDLIAFTDISPAAHIHIQVLPKKHIGTDSHFSSDHTRIIHTVPSASVRSLTRDDITILKSMQKVGDKLLDHHNIKHSMRKMGFHIPPFNSVDHLHLHVQAAPYSSAFRAFAYPICKGRGTNHKGLSWFVEVKQAIQILESERQIGILPC